MITAGAEKASALAAVLEGPPKPNELPSQLLAPLTGRLVWLVDREAAQNLKQAVPTVFRR